MEVFTVNRHMAQSEVADAKLNQCCQLARNLVNNQLQTFELGINKLKRIFINEAENAVIKHKRFNK